MRNNKRGYGSKVRGTHQNLISDADETLPDDPFLDDEASEGEESPFDLDLRDLARRGVLEREKGEASLDSESGINRDHAWTSETLGRVRGKYILVPREFTPYVRAIFAGLQLKSQRLVWREMLWLFGRTRTVLIEVRSVVSRKTWFGIVNSREASLGSEKLLYLICADAKNGMHYEFSETGVGGFEISFVGFFARLDEAMDYREFLINRRLDEGWGSYNELEFDSGGLKRWVAVELGFSTVSRLQALTASRRLRIKDVVTDLVLKWIHRESRR